MKWFSSNKIPENEKNLKGSFEILSNEISFHSFTSKYLLISIKRDTQNLSFDNIIHFYINNIRNIYGQYIIIYFCFVKNI